MADSPPKPTKQERAMWPARLRHYIVNLERLVAKGSVKKPANDAPSPRQIRRMKMVSQFRMIGIVAGALIAVAGALAVFGVEDIPRPAWSSELKSLAGNVVELDSRVTSQQLDDTKLRYFQNARERRKFPDDNLLIQEQVGLESKIDELEYRLDELRDDD